MKTISTLIIFICTSIGVSAQGFADQFFSSYGFSPFLDMGAGPGQVRSPVYSSDGYDSACFAYQNSYIGVSMAYEARYNLVQPSDNMAISIKSKPTLNVSMSSEGLMGVYIPLGIGLEVGNGSTYQSESNVGFTFTAGYSLNFNPLVKTGDIYERAKYYNVDLKTNWSSPYIAAGVRYWNRNNKLREINILYGFGSANDEMPSNAQQLGIESNLDTDDFGGSYMLCISWMIYMNY